VIWHENAMLQDAALLRRFVAEGSDDAFRAQFTLVQGRAPASLAELVGPDELPLRLRPVAGEW